MKIKTSELTGPALDWAVAKAETLGTPAEEFGMPVNVFLNAYYYYGGMHYSTNWAQGGPIIDQEKLSTGGGIRTKDWGASTLDGKVSTVGPTTLIAAMRCFVSSKLGNEVDIPEALLK